MERGRGHLEYPAWRRPNLRHSRRKCCQRGRARRRDHSGASLASQSGGELRHRDHRGRFCLRSVGHQGKHRHQSPDHAGTYHCGASGFPGSYRRDGTHRCHGRNRTFRPGGASGPAGPAGATGATGPTGSAGAAGAVGARALRPGRCHWRDRTFRTGGRRGPSGRPAQPGPPEPGGPRVPPARRGLLDRKARPASPVPRARPVLPAPMAPPATSSISILPCVPHLARPTPSRRPTHFCITSPTIPVGTSTTCGGAITLNLPVSTVVGAGRMVIASPGNVPNRSRWRTMSWRCRGGTRVRCPGTIGDQRLGPPDRSSQRWGRALDHHELRRALVRRSQTKERRITNVVTLRGRNSNVRW